MNFSIITIGYANYGEIIETCQSVNHQLLQPFEHVLILSGLKDSEKMKIKELFSASYRKFIFDQDSSLYNAMNIGMRMAIGDSILFLNAGDVFFSDKSIQAIKDNFVSGKCLAGRTQQVYRDLCFVRPGLKHLQQLIKGPGHQGFVAPLESSLDHRLYFNESNLIAADQDWMEGCMKKYGIVITSEILARMYLGGVSNAPNINGIVLRIKSRQYWSAANAVVKSLISRFFTKKQYYMLLSKIKGYDIFLSCNKKK